MRQANVMHMHISVLLKIYNIELAIVLSLSSMQYLLGAVSVHTDRGACVWLYVCLRVCLCLNAVVQTVLLLCIWVVLERVESTKYINSNNRHMPHVTYTEDS